MRSISKAICFLMLIGVALGQMFSLAGMEYQLKSVSPCLSEQECQEQYVRNIIRCLPDKGGRNQENFCGTAIDPAYIAVQENWETRLDKFRDIANAEEKKLSHEALQDKQERIRESIKEKFNISETKVAIAEYVVITR